MDFCFCGRYINIDANDKEVERDMYAVISYFWCSNDYIEYEKWKNLKEFFSYFVLASEQKYHYTQMKLVGQAS